MRRARKLDLRDVDSQNVHSQNVHSQNFDLQKVDLQNVDLRNVNGRNEEAPEQMAENWKQWQGQVIEGRFHLLNYLGGSEPSAVFVAEQKREPRQLAVKLILTDAAQRERLLSQWTLAQQLSHPHLLRIFETGRSQFASTELIFVAMEYADENLAQVLPHRPLTPAETIEMLSPTLDALAYLHEQGFVHGRLRPANVMAIQDRVKLATDNVCKANEATFDASEAGAYDAPETLRGDITSAADVWSLGMMLTEALTQRLPRQPRGAAPLVLPENLPAPFDEIIRGCLHPEPQQRWKVTDVAARLNLRLPALEKRAPASPSIVSRRKRFLTAASVTVLALVTLIAGAKLLQHRPEVPEEASASKPEPATQASLNPTSLSPANANGAATAYRSKPSPISPRSPAHAVVADGGSQAGDVVHQVLPNVPQKALDTIHGTLKVVVKVQVDRSGNVTGADFDSAGPSQYFARLAMQAAKNWTFAPYPQDHDREFLVHFDFTNTGTTASATRARG